MLPPFITPEQFAALSPEFQAMLLAFIHYYEDRCAKLEARITELEARVNQSPRIFSLPRARNIRTQIGEIEPCETDFRNLVPLMNIQETS